MPETIIITVAAEIAAGPTVKESRTLSIDAYDKISVTVPDGERELEVELQPGGEGSVRVLIVTSSQYGDTLEYTVNAGTTRHALDQPHILLGTAADRLLGAAPAKLVFENALGGGEDAEIQILIGRDATP